jgi:hypothetical protein
MPHCRKAAAIMSPTELVSPSSAHLATVAGPEVRVGSIATGRASSKSGHVLCSESESKLRVAHSSSFPRSGPLVAQCRFRKFSADSVSSLRGVERVLPMLDVRHAPIVTKFCIAAECRDVPKTGSRETYSMTSSARSSNEGGSCKPSCRAAFWLTTNSNSVGA